MIVPLFALANAGVIIPTTDTGKPVATATMLRRMLGEPIGIFCFS